MADPEESIVGEAGGNVDEVHVSLRIASDALDLQEVTRLIGQKPSMTEQKGEQAEIRGRIRTRTSVWLLTLPTASECTVEDGILALLNVLPYEPSIWAALRALGRVEILLGLHLNDWNRGFHVGSGTLGRLAAIGVDLDCDIYADWDEDA